jgi:hypothetical protein
MNASLINNIERTSFWQDVKEGCSVVKREADDLSFLLYYLARERGE